MRSRPIGTPLTAEEAAVVARFDAAEPAPESFNGACVTCRHVKQDHSATQGGKVLCFGSVVCGCGEYVAVAW